MSQPHNISSKVHGLHVQATELGSLAAARAAVNEAAAEAGARGGVVTVAIA